MGIEPTTVACTVTRFNGRVNRKSKHIICIYLFFYYIFRVNMEEANSAQIIAGRNISINDTTTGKFILNFLLVSSGKFF